MIRECQVYIGREIYGILCIVIKKASNIKLLQIGYGYVTFDIYKRMVCDGKSLPNKYPQNEEGKKGKMKKNREIYDKKPIYLGPVGLDGTYGTYK